MRVGEIDLYSEKRRYNTMGKGIYILYGKGEKSEKSREPISGGEKKLG